MSGDRRRGDDSQARRTRRNEREIAAARLAAESVGRTKEEQEKAYEAKLEAEKNNPRCIECEICCEPRAPHRIVACEHPHNPHSYCEVCVRHHLKDTIFERSSPFLRCLAPGCVATYQRADYERVLDADALAMRDRLETRMSLKNIEGLTPCPSCDFAAFVDEGVEIFECQNSRCRKSFCLKCNGDPHPGVSCRQAGKRHQSAAAQEAKADPSQKLEELRRKVEDEISDALIRRCGDCNAPFVKAEGCNEMRCICGNVTCYACKAQHITPRHWGRGCKHFELTEAREEAERKVAEERAIAKVMRDNPGLGLKAGDLKVGEVSERVKRDDRRKKRRAQAELRGELWMPGMAVEDGDRHLMADMQAQMEGLDPFDRRGMGNFMAPIPALAPVPGPERGTGFGGLGRRNAVDLGRPRQTTHDDQVIVTRRDPHPFFFAHQSAERQPVERESFLVGAMRQARNLAQRHRRDEARTFADAERMLDSALAQAADLQRLHEELANPIPNFRFDPGRQPVFVDGQAIDIRHPDGRPRFIDLRPREHPSPPELPALRTQRIEDFLGDPNEPEYIPESEMFGGWRR